MIDAYIDLTGDISPVRGLTNPQNNSPRRFGREVHTKKSRNTGTCRNGQTPKRT